MKNVSSGGLALKIMIVLSLKNHYVENCDRFLPSCKLEVDL